MRPQDCYHEDSMKIHNFEVQYVQFMDQSSSQAVWKCWNAACSNAVSWWAGQEVWSFESFFLSLDAWEKQRSRSFNVRLVTDQWQVLSILRCYIHTLPQAVPVPELLQHCNRIKLSISIRSFLAFQWSAVTSRLSRPGLSAGVPQDFW